MIIFGIGFRLLLVAVALVVERLGGWVRALRGRQEDGRTPSNSSR